jgi:hypothetical protein
LPAPPVITGEGCGLNQPFTSTKTNLWDTGRWCGEAVPAGPYNVGRRDACLRLYVGRPDYTTECAYVLDSGSTYKCKLVWPPFYPCEYEASPPPPPPSRKPPPPPPPSPPPFTGASNCGLAQPFTLTRTNLWDTGRWCGDAVPVGLFDGAKRDTCNRYYVGRPDYSAECAYIPASGGKYKCALTWPPFYPCEGELTRSPPPPPPPLPPLVIAGDCGLAQPFTLTRTNLWDTGRWCGDAVPRGRFDSGKRDACGQFYVGRPDYTAECAYALVSGVTGDSTGDYKCNLVWPPYYTCESR